MSYGQHSPVSNLGADLLDQQFAVQMSGQPGGLSDLIAQQLSRQMGAPESTKTNAGIMPVQAPTSALSRATSVAAYGAPVSKPTTSQSSFVHQHSEQPPNMSTVWPKNLWRNFALMTPTKILFAITPA